ncbi:hypothetical protein LGL55_02315 [Clostridium tagluense]|uniref:hypothetical protein n=1 Tax=Clostridium tagluense TaxID=360422 RepID=UPI001C6E9372|nr:hypothetical protein [Clostridium tagluense]MBW9156296.1 hypothetical protein [Clostridium tagluense]MCB2309952.1 hypothetical protein [Clostridium tagluense]MCB2314518.1 hypothetical protein [Clostridium tagluense]MCB2319366.1 hypothetical protein [Clostridium tagluense]MCB2324546.1 hypothetical protein [Clostridium tagluense]
MKFRRNMLLEVSAERISGIGFSKNRILNRVNTIACGNTYYKDTLNIKDFEMDIKNKNLYVLVEGETVYIKMITLPLVKKHLINDLIKNELRYYYKDIEHISFTYKLIKKDKFNMEILVFCLSGNKLNVLESSIDNNISLKKVNLIQFCFKNYYCNKIHEKNYILVFYYNDILYFIICNNDEIVANTIVRVVDLLLFKFSYAMNEFLDKYNDYAKLCKKIYYVNVEGLNIEEFKYLTLPKEILENLKREQLLKYMIIKG